MKQIFPPEIIVHSTEAHFYHHNKKFKWIYALSLILIISAFIVLPLIKVELSSQGRGIIRTPFESSQIQSSFAGQVLVNNMSEGQAVIKGDTLLTLRTDQLKEQVQLLERQLKENLIFISDLNKLPSHNSPFKTNRYQLENIQYQSQIKELEVSIELLKKEYQIALQLYNELVMPEMEFLQAKNKYDAAVSQLNVFKKQSVNTWQVEKTRLEQENLRLHSNINKLEKECDQYIIKAPISGTLAQTIGIHTGSFISPGQALAQISPDEQLLAECFITPTDIGFITIGQDVRFQLDAFNYNQWGLIHGKVIAVSDDIVVINNQPVFKVRCELPHTYLELKSGHKGHLKKGMSLTGRFVLTERTLYQLLFDKMDDWLNPKQLKND